MKEKKFYIEKKVSKKTNKEYTGLYVDLGYKVSLVSVDTVLICDLTDMTPKQIFELPIDSKVEC